MSFASVVVDAVDCVGCSGGWTGPVVEASARGRDIGRHTTEHDRSDVPSFVVSVAFIAFVALRMLRALH